MRSLKDLMSSGASRAAIALGLPAFGLRRDRQVAVTSTCGKRGTNYRRIIKHVRTGPWHRQIGIKWRNGEALPLMQTYFVDEFLHATKGWRVYSHGLPGTQRPARRA